MTVQMTILSMLFTGGLEMDGTGCYWPGTDEATTNGRRFVLSVMCLLSLRSPHTGSRRCLLLRNGKYWLDLRSGKRFW
jgi:hypothetical protein